MTLDARLRRFLRQDESGALMAEAVLVLPFMLWSYLALFVYWDSYRAVNTVSPRLLGRKSTTAMRCSGRARRTMRCRS